jgi:hypothetical protein
MASSRGLKKMWCVLEISSEFIDRMEDVLRLYARKLDLDELVVCLDERPVVLREDARRGEPMAPGKLARTDYENVRCETANIFCIVEPLTGRRMTFATANRKAPAFVRALRKIAQRYRSARRIHLVMDNLNIHFDARSRPCSESLRGGGCGTASCCTTRPGTRAGSMPPSSKRASSRASVSGSGAVPSLVDLISLVAAWRRCAEEEHRIIEWRFRVDDARRVFRYEGLTTRRSEH